MADQPDTTWFGTVCPPEVRRSSCRIRWPRRTWASAGSPSFPDRPSMRSSFSWPRGVGVVALLVATSCGDNGSGQESDRLRCVGRRGCRKRRRRCGRRDRSLDADRDRKNWKRRWMPSLPIRTPLDRRTRRWTPASMQCPSSRATGTRPRSKRAQRTRSQARPARTPGWRMVGRFHRLPATAPVLASRRTS